MLPISGSTVPDTTAALREALLQGLSRYEIVPKNVQLEGDSVSVLRTLAIDLSGANLTRATRPPKDISVGQHALEVDSFRMEGNPLLIELVPATFSLTGDHVRFSQGTAEGALFLVPQDASSALLRMEISRESLETLIQRIGGELAGKQGVEIKETHVELISKGDKELSFRAEIVGKVFVMKAPVTLTGDVSIDEQLNFRISNLAVGGSGMIATLANNFAQPHLRRAEAQPISLAVLNLGSLKVRDIRLRGGDTLLIEAQLSS
jgi:hypothetical protein